MQKGDNPIFEATVQLAAAYLASGQRSLPQDDWLGFLEEVRGAVEVLARHEPGGYVRRVNGQDFNLGAVDDGASLEYLAEKEEKIAKAKHQP